MTQEQKAQAYDEAVEKANELIYVSDKDSLQRKTVEHIFPELKESESEDEKIRKAILNYFTKCWGNCKDDVCGIHVEDAIAWLEKQGKKNKWRPSKDEMEALYGLSYITNKMDDKKDEAITKLYQDLKREFFDGASYENMFPSSPVDAPIKDEKQGEQKSYASETMNEKRDFDSGFTRMMENEQKPADKVEPKFKVGDWVIFNNKHQSIYLVEKIEDGYYILRHTHGGTFRVCILHDESIRLWTIQDAKDGDVLIDKSGSRECPFIFKETKPSKIKTYMLNPLAVLGYCGIGGAGFTKGSGWGDTANCIYYPATKEQRDLLFAKMKEEGYEWNAEKKELKKKNLIKKR